MNTANNHILLGAIIGLHGVRGWVKLYSQCRPKENIFNYKEFIAIHPETLHSQTLKLSAGKEQGKGLIAQFTEINTRDQAASLLQYNLYINRTHLPKAQKDDYYWHDLIGLQVFNLQNEHLGSVHSLFETGANDVLVVKPINKNSIDILIPFVKQHYIYDIILPSDQHNGHIIVDWDSQWLED